MDSHSSTSILYVPIDFGKNINWYNARSGFDLARVWPDQQVYNDRTGYTRLAEDLRQALVSGQYAALVVGYEPTGVYHEAWIQALLGEFGAALTVRQIHPATSHAKRRELQRGRPRKSDRLDLDALSHCLRDGLATPAPHWTALDLRFEVWASQYGTVQQDLTRAKQRLGSQLDRLWPGLLVDTKQFAHAHPGVAVPEPLLRSRPWERALLRALVQHAPNPYDWLSWSAAQIQAFVRQHTGRCGPKTLAKIQGGLARGLYLPPDLARLLAERLQADFQLYLALETRLSSLAASAEALVADTPAAVLVTIPGMSAVLAARYVGHVGPRERFTSPAQVWAFAGFDPSLNDSGDQRGEVHISQKGAPAFRDTLYLIGFHTAQHCPAIGQAHRRALQHGKGGVGAVLHAAHKANRMCFHLYTTQQPYDPHHAH